MRLVILSFLDALWFCKFIMSLVVSPSLTKEKKFKKKGIFILIEHFCYFSLFTYVSFYYYFFGCWFLPGEGSVFYVSCMLVYVVDVGYLPFCCFILYLSGHFVF